MLSYALILLSLVLVGVTGLQFSYMFYLERLDRERKKRLRDLELYCNIIQGRLESAETRLAEQEQLLKGLFEGSEEETWADVIDDR
ncbi:MAG: hypothetical protein WBD22_12265 [Pyrinomonadaceae bacterium]